MTDSPPVDVAADASGSAEATAADDAHFTSAQGFAHKRRGRAAGAGEGTEGRRSFGLGYDASGEGDALTSLEQQLGTEFACVWLAWMGMWTSRELRCFRAGQGVCGGWGEETQMITAAR